MIEFTWYAGLSLVLLMLVANLVVWRVQQAVVHSAVDQGVRSGSLYDVDPVGACQARMDQVLTNLLSGPAGAGTTYGCTDDGEVVHATVRFTLHAWLPPLVDHDRTSSGEARKERAP